MKRVLAILLATSLSCSNERTESVLSSNESKSLQPIKESSTRGENAPSENVSSEAGSVLVMRSVLNGVEVLIPRTFKVMDAEMIALKYPLKERAAFLVYTDEDATVNIAFEHTPNKATLKDLPAIKQVLEQQFNQPGIDFRKSEVRKINDRDFIVLEMITPAVDTEVYNLMFVTTLEGRLMIGTFNCTVEKQEEWRSLAERILGSVNVKD